MTDCLTLTDTIINPEHLDLWVMVSAAEFNVPLRILKIMSLTCKKYYQYTLQRLLRCKDISKRYLPLFAKGLCNMYLANMSQYKYTSSGHRIVQFKYDVYSVTDTIASGYTPWLLFPTTPRAWNYVFAVSTIWLLLNDPVPFLASCVVTKEDLKFYTYTTNNYIDTGNIMGDEQSIRAANDGRIPGRYAVKLILPSRYCPVICETNDVYAPMGLYIRPVISTPVGTNCEYLAEFANNITHAIVFTKVAHAHEPARLKLDCRRIPLSKYLLR